MRLVEQIAETTKKIAGEEVQEIQTLDGTKLLFADESWLLFRQSGTEPVLRIYSEATSTVKVNKLLDAGEKLTQSVSASG
jgi:phosphomannomutase